MGSGKEHTDKMEKYINTLKERNDALENDLKHFSAIHHNIVSDNLLKKIGKDYTVLDKESKKFNPKKINELAKSIKDSYILESKNVLKEGLSDDERDKWIKTLYNVNQEEIEQAIKTHGKNFTVDLYKEIVIKPHAKDWYKKHANNVSSHIQQDDISDLVKYIGADKHMKGHEENINSMAYLPWLTQVLLNAKQDKKNKNWSVDKTLLESINAETEKAENPYHAGPWMKK